MKTDHLSHYCINDKCYKSSRIASDGTVASIPTESCRSNPMQMHGPSAAPKVLKTSCLTVENFAFPNNVLAIPTQVVIAKMAMAMMAMAMMAMAMMAMAMAMMEMAMVEMAMMVMAMNGNDGNDGKWQWQ